MLPPFFQITRVVALSRNVPMDIANPLDSSRDVGHRIRLPDAVRERAIMCATHRVEPTEKALGTFHANVP